MAGEIEPGTNMVLPVKFVGGLLSLGSGMALGREGPTVQMGATIGHIIAPWIVREEDDHRVVLAAGAGAGLAVAFNAPIGGSVFVFEELTTSFTPWLLVATLSAATFAVAVMRWMIGNQYVFFVLPGNAPGGNDRLVLPAAGRNARRGGSGIQPAVTADPRSVGEGSQSTRR